VVNIIKSKYGKWYCREIRGLRDIVFRRNKVVKDRGCGSWFHRRIKLVRPGVGGHGLIEE
jgi:hypothetical protein